MKPFKCVICGKVVERRYEDPSGIFFYKYCEDHYYKYEEKENGL